MTKGCTTNTLAEVQASLADLSEDDRKSIICSLTVDFALEFPRKNSAQLTINHLAMNAIAEVTARETATAIKEHRAKMGVV